ncbi:MAG: type II toxin-antitoxin system HigB family toxin [Rikenellaceae bacterium]|nr:type II toxin-antitoxin system HigB family toxin [Rikenellaceae bacterium]
MRVVARKSVVMFYRKHADAETALEEWYQKVGNAQWDCFADMKKDFNSVDAVGDRRYIFNIKGNDYRLVTIVLFKIKMIYIRHICTHAEYDKIDDCSKL